MYIPNKHPLPPERPSSRLFIGTERASTARCMHDLQLVHKLAAPMVLTVEEELDGGRHKLGLRVKLRLNKGSEDRAQESKNG
jgi:hypothetical protein